MYTYPVFMNVNLTLSIDEDVLERARRVAEHQGASLNALVRDYLARLAGKHGGPDLAREIRDTFGRPLGRPDRDWVWSRDELYSDRVGRRRG